MHHHNKHDTKKLASAEIALGKFLSSVNFNPKIEMVAIQNASSRVLGKDVISKIEIPSFTNGWVCNKIS